MRTPIAALALVLALSGASGALAPAASAQTLNQLGIQRLNQDAQALWQHDGLTMANQQVQIQLDKLVGVAHPIDSRTSATITKINSFTLNCAIAPGLTRCDGARIEGALPLAGDWTITASADVRVKGRELGINFDITRSVTIEIRELKASFRIDLDSTDPAAPKLVQAHAPVIDFKLKLTSSSWLLNFLSWLTRPLVNEVAQAAIKVAMQKVIATANLKFAGTPAVVGEGGGAGLATLPPADLHAAARKIENDTFASKLPHGCVTEGWYSTDFTGTWEDSVRQNLVLGPLDMARVGHAGDSALMTGYLLEGEAMRYAVTRSPEAKARGQLLLRTFRTLLSMRGENGNLNRAIAPWHGEPLSQDEYVQSFQGVDYVMSDYVSRDAYTGTFVGLSCAYDLFDDAAMKADAKEQIEWALDYLLRNNWTWRKRDGSWGERWAGAIEHQYAWVLAGARVNPAKYAATMQAYKGYADILWTAVWTGVVDPLYQYYKFSLVTQVMFTALRLEQDPVAWQRAYQGMAILRRFIGHHQNAQFNNCYVASDPGARAALGAENRILMTHFLRSPRRYMIHDLRNDPSIEKISYTVPIDTNLLFPGQGVPQTFDIAKRPIPIEKRVSAGYRWSRSPVILKEDFLWNPEPRHEGEGVDYILPYWMGRYYGTIPAPRIIVRAGTASAATPATTAAIR